MFISLIRNNCFHPYESVKHWAHQILKLFKIEENVYVHGKKISIFVNDNLIYLTTIYNSHIQRLHAD